MTHQIIDGKAIAKGIRTELREKTREWIQAGNRPPKLVAVLVGSDGGSITYVRHKEKACREIGFDSEILHLPDDIGEAGLLTRIAALNASPGVDGFIVQLPLPENISERKVIEAIDPSRDVDGFHPVNLGRMVNGIPGFVSATPAGIMTLLERTGISLAGKHCTILGRSNIVGRPLSILMSQKGADATVTLCHSRTRRLEEHTRRADILVAALGKPGYVTKQMVKEGAVVIDVGTTRLPSSKTKSGFKLHGDVDYEAVAPQCSLITPVPGGVGPMTIVSLMINTFRAATGEYVY